MQQQHNIRSIEEKWESLELNQKLAEGDVKASITFEIDYMYLRELRNGCFER